MGKVKPIGYAKEYNKTQGIIPNFLKQINNYKKAVICNDKSLTYQELDDLSSILAADLLKSGIRQEEVVAILLNPSVYIPVAMIGILKAGCAFLPVDPAYPQERINYLLENSNVSVVISSREIHAVCNKKTIYIEELKKDALPFQLTGYPADNLAYVIYTSGSTGKPKGVMIQHYSILNFIAGIEDKIDYSNLSSCLAMATITFDVSIMEILISLLMGLTIVIADQETRQNAALISGLIIDQNVDLMLITPSRLSMFLDSPKLSSGLKKLKAIIITGENISPELIRSLKAVTDAKIYNGYGPTETTLGCFFQEIVDEKKIDIGQPMANTYVYLMDGELCIAGDGLARGYINNPEATEKAFIQNPYDTGRLYKSGDKAELLDGANIRILGRLDNQVKIRGMRVELGEIEQVLLEDKRILQCAVIIKNEDTANPQLAAFLKGKDLPVESVIRERLLKTLPDYMIPFEINIMESMPLTFSGKIDRQTLKTMNITKAQSGVTVNDQWSKTEEQVRHMISNIEGLKIPALSLNADDSILEWGVTSIHFLKIILALESEFDFELDLSKVSLASFPTVRSMINYIENRKSGSL